MAIFQGKTIEDAINQGLLALNIEKEQAEITVLEEPQKGFLGISPEVLFFITFDEDGIAIACEEGYRPGG